MAIEKGLLKKKGERTATVPVEAAVAYGLKPGPSLVQQIRAKKQREAKRAERRAKREARRERRERRSKKDG